MAKEIREYELFIEKPFMVAVSNGNGELTDIAPSEWHRREQEIKAKLNEAGARGFRLMRAEADGNGVMWLVMERVREAAAEKLPQPSDRYRGVPNG
jgi:hypothetical protein